MWLSSLWLNYDDANYRMLFEDKKHIMTDFRQPDWLKEQLRDLHDDEACNAKLWSALRSKAFGCTSWIAVSLNDQLRLLP